MEETDGSHEIAFSRGKKSVRLDRRFCARKQGLRRRIVSMSYLFGFQARIPSDMPFDEFEKFNALNNLPKRHQSKSHQP